MYRPASQLRMPSSLFKYITDIISPQVHVAYADYCAVDRPRCVPGEHFGTFAVTRGAVPSLRGKLLHIFLHCPNAAVIQPEGSNSDPKVSPKQEEAASAAPATS
ncbi:hypothetical protein IMZ48_11640 [Candidatus Bathyarchaeota archaeon]|nr:hypothetical protein [Candidatus Bathyarchaeota archaeon]